MSASDETSIVIIFGAAALAPFAADRLARWLPVPSVVVELVLGILIGPVVLGWAGLDPVVSGLANFGLAVLMFLAGYEIDFGRIRGAPLTLACRGWAVSLVLGLLAGLAVSGLTYTALVVGLALTTTALGTLLPILGDRGLLPTPLGARVMAIGAVGEFGPIVAIALLLTSKHPLRTGVLLVVFVLIAAVSAYLAVRRSTHPVVRRLVETTLETSGQLAVRFSVFVIVAMLWLTDRFGLDVLLGAFAAGIIAHLSMQSGSSRQREVVKSKLEAIGYGFVVPFFFVVSGLKMDLDAMFSDPASLAVVPIFLLLFLLVRGLPTLLLSRRTVPPAESRSLALLASAALPLVVVITGIGTDSGDLKGSTAAAMVCAGMLSVLLFPLLALRRIPRTTPGEDVPVEA